MRGGTWCFAACFSSKKNAPTFWDLFLSRALPPLARRLCFARLGGNEGGFVPDGAEVAEPGYGGGNEGEGFVDLLGGGEAGEREADAGAGAGGREAHRGEDVGGFSGAGLAGRASADRESLEVEGDDESFGFDMVEVEAGGVGDSGGAFAVDSALLYLREEALFEAVAEGGEVGGAVCGVVFGEPGVR